MKQKCALPLASDMISHVRRSILCIAPSTQCGNCYGDCLVQRGLYVHISISVTSAHSIRISEKNIEFTRVNKCIPAIMEANVGTSAAIIFAKRWLSRGVYC